MLEGAHEEIRRREKAISKFIYELSTLQLIASVLNDVHEDWTSSNSHYISFTKESINFRK